MNRGAFDNIFQDYTLAAACNYLSEFKNVISDTFKSKLEDYKTVKLLLLTNEMKNNIFYDSVVYTGSCGLAYYYLMKSLNSNDVNTSYLKDALQYINIEKLKGKRISFLCGDAGPLAVFTVILYKLGAQCPQSLPSYKQVLERLLSLNSLLGESPNEILYGKAGYLYALLFVKKYIPEEDIIPHTHFEKVVAAILKSGRKLASNMNIDCPLIWEWHDKIYLGAAHGMAGILYMLLQARSYIRSNDMQGLVKPTIDWLINLQYPSGNFPSSLDSASGDRLVQWCHGAPGFVPLLLTAYEVFKDDIYLYKALQCGDVIWRRGLCTKGYSICHGVSGNAYAFLQLFQATKDPKHLYRACKFAEWCMAERESTEMHTPDRPASLFEGLLGRIYFVEDFINLDCANFPAFTL